VTLLIEEKIEPSPPERSRRRAPKDARAPKPPKPPKPPRRVPRPRKASRPLTPMQATLRMVSALLAILLLGMTLYLMVFSRLTHVIAQDRLNDQLREQLSEGTAPVSEGTFEDVLLQDGAPVAQLRIPQIGVDETVAEGTTSGVLMSGPGHRRDTMLPGQFGTSVVMGRAAAFGGPFGRLQELQPGDKISVVTGQGEHVYEVIGVRYAGDPAPAPITFGEGRLVLVTARGPAFLPSGALRVDAELVSDVQAPGTRATTHAGLPKAAQELQGDASHLWALVFALQALVLVEIGAVWTYRNIGARQTWIVFLPVGLLASLAAADQLTRLLPNLL